MGDHKHFQARFIELRTALLADGIRCRVPFRMEDIQTIVARLKTEGISFAQVTLPLLGKALDAGLVSGTFKCPTSFRLVKNTRLPVFLYAAFADIFDTAGNLKANASEVTILHLRQFLLLDSKLEMAYNAKTQDRFIQEFIQGQSDLRKISVSGHSPVLDVATQLLGRVFSRWKYTWYTPGHGPGATAEGFDREDKWKFTSWPAKAEREFPYLMYGTPNIGVALRTGPIRLTHKSVTRGCLVPKDFRGPRLISIEPTAMQYLQQGMMRRMMQYFENNDLLRRSIRMDDQTFNRTRAGKAIEQEYATIDLSSASDTLSAVVVWRLLSKVPRLRRQLFSLRSDFVAFGTKEVRLVAFAPMGSAICFPVETLVFWAIAVAVLKVHNPTKSFWDLAGEVRVFGDDIVYPNTYELPILLRELQSIGCRPNMSKTCYMTPFRESCGGEWFGDVDVTIIRNKHYPYSSRRAISEHPVLLDLQRKFFLRGFYRTADLLSRWAEEIYPIMTIEPDALPRNREGLIDNTLFAYGFTSTLGRVPYRFNKSYQSLQALTPVLIQKTRGWRYEDHSRLTARLISDSTERISLRDSNIHKAWRQVPFYMGVTAPRLA